MAKLTDRVEAELENIQEVLNRLPSATKLSSIKDLELAGVATLLHNFYNGNENIIKQIISSKGVSIPQGPSWHRDLLDLALKHKVINKTAWRSLKQFLGFRHFFNHAYAFRLEVNRMRPLVKTAPRLFDSIKRGIQKSLD
jgi:uncharacterized protein YutE (UPF0331/DUF86 family)